MMPLGWGTGGRGDRDRDIERAPRIAGIEDVDGQSASGGDPRGDASDAERIGKLPALPMQLVPIPGAIEVWLHLGALH